MSSDTVQKCKDRVRRETEVLSVAWTKAGKSANAPESAGFVFFLLELSQTASFLKVKEVSCKTLIEFICPILHCYTFASLTLIHL